MGWQSHMCQCISESHVVCLQITAGLIGALTVVQRRDNLGTAGLEAFDPWGLVWWCEGGLVWLDGMGPWLPQKLEPSICVPV